MTRARLSGVAALIVSAALVAGCGSRQDRPGPEPTFRADLDAQFAGPQGCVPNPRPAPKADLPYETGTPLREQRVVITPDASWERRYGSSSDDVIAATATLLSSTVRRELPTSAPGVPANPRVPGFGPDRSGDRFVIVRYRLRNTGRFTTTPGQVSGHLLVGADDRWLAPVVGCRFSEGQQVQDLVATETDASTSAPVAPGASATTLAVYVVPGGAKRLRWASSPDFARATPLTPVRGAR